MACFIATLGSDKENWQKVNRIISSKKFSHIYLIADGYADVNYKEPSGTDDLKMSLLMLDLKDAALPASIDSLSAYLKKRFSEDKILELDIAVNISSGTGSQHAVLLSSVMRLGYGIRLIDVDNMGTIVEL